MELPEISVTASDEEKLTVAQDTLRSMASINEYIQEHPGQQEAVSVLVAVTQGPKGLVQLAVYNAVSETPLGQSLNQKLASTATRWVRKSPMPWKAKNSATKRVTITT
ncbi:hypothetical protein ACTACU_00005 [Pseudomonas syringae]|uniref:hypothetical protein n=1 Tax=Pseudomonas syringae TaxID=317 RepID=UPI003F8630ED